MNDSKPQTEVEGIAIVGMSCRLPGAKNFEEFWEYLRNGVELVSFFTEQELLKLGVDPAAVKSRNYVKAKAVLEDVEWFDASFFGFNPREAEMMDPQHRLFLECASEALESAGYDPDTYQGLIGVYAGASISTYLLNLYANRHLYQTLVSHDFFQTLISNDKDFLPTRVSYKLNLKGPSVTVQTACSTSLVAVHLACQSLLNYECDLALAGGVSIGVPHKAGHFYQEGGIFSPDGHCRSFDAKSQGFVVGNGVGIVSLKRLADALTDGDCIYAVIKGSAINNDGSVKVGYTAPSVDGQAQVIAMAQAVAGVEPETISYIEAHGTGTPVGDPIEIAALNQVFSLQTEKKGFCAIGSVKTNLGHLDHAAGITALIKTVLALKHKLLPPSLHFEQPNPRIDFANSPFYVNTTLSNWPVGSTARRAGVSAFGMGGTNAHAILEEAPILEASGPSRPWHLLVLSAKTSSALEIATANLAVHLKQHPELNLADVAYTYQVGRRAFSHRRILVCHDLDDAVSSLEMFAPKHLFTAIAEPRERSVVFMFSGQGEQYVDMARELYQVEATFRSSVDICAELLRPHLGLDLRHVLYPSPQEAESAIEQLQQTAIIQPALFVIEYALAKLWMQWGVRPQAMIGHSIGEYVAACLAGVFSLAEALALVAVRGRLMQLLPRGVMLAVPLPENEVQPFLGEQLSLAEINGPSLCVVSGPEDAQAQLESQLAQTGVECRRLHTNHAFHSVMMEPIVAQFAIEVKRVNLKPPSIPYVSNVTGTWITVKEATDPNYWATHLHQTVRFSEGMHSLQQPQLLLLEVGPGRTLSTLAKLHLDQSTEHIVLSSVRQPQDHSSDVAFLLTTLGQLWLAGIQVDWSAFYAQQRRHRLPLPTYPFERQRYWIEPQHHSSNGKKPDVADWFYISSWTKSSGAVGGEETTKEKLCWLIFIDRCGLGDKIVNRLLGEGQDVITVMVGEQFSQISDRGYTINPRQRDDYDALLEDLCTLNKTPKIIAHLWNVNEEDKGEARGEKGTEDLFLGFWSLLFLTQAVDQQNITDSLQISVITNNMQSVSGQEELCPHKATILGACKVIGQEYRNITCHSIDITIPQSGTWLEEKLINQLLAELALEPSDVPIAYRGFHRWVQTFEPIRLDKAVTGTTRLREGGVYLITGGLGGIGFTFAQYLAQTVRAKLVLLGRKAFPDTRSWGEWLATHDVEDDTSRKIRQVQALEQLGADVLVVSADVANHEQMLWVITQASERFGKIHGVIHAAGIASVGMIQLKTPEAAASVLATTIRGTQVLELIFQDEKLDFLALCSSLSSILGGIGLVDYCAANAFLDAFAHKNCAMGGTFTVSINWDTWQEVGMAVNKKWRKEILEKGISSKEGMDAISRILCSQMPQVVVSTQDIQARIKQAYAASNAIEELEQALLFKPTYRRPQLESAYIAPRNEVEQTVADIWQRILGIERVGIYDNFFDLGGHSLLATQLISHLRDTFQVELPMQALFESRTVADSAIVIAQRLTEELTDETLAQMLAEIEQLSPDEVLTILGTEK